MLSARHYEEIRDPKMHNGRHDADQNIQLKQCLRCLWVLFRQQEIRQGKKLTVEIFVDKKL